MDRITNEEILEKNRAKRTLWNHLNKRKAQIIGHKLKHRGLLRKILQAEVGKKRNSQD